MIIKEEKKVEYCSQCPFCEAKRIHTADSFEHVYELICKKLNECVHMVEWNEKGKCDTPLTKCPFNKETTDLHEMIERFKVEFAKLSMDEQLEFVRDNAFLHTIWQCGYAEAIKRYEANKGNPTEFESLGNHLRNLLSPYQTLVDVVQEYNDGEFDESEFKSIIGNAQLQVGIDKVIEFSKHPKMEHINWR